MSEELEQYGKALKGTGLMLADVDLKKREAGGYVKCPRCWHFHTVFANFDFLCDRCASIIRKFFPDHPAAAEIRESSLKFERRDSELHICKNCRHFITTREEDHAMGGLVVYGNCEAHKMEVDAKRYCFAWETKK